jgi:hypothetical protein
MTRVLSIPGVVDSQDLRSLHPEPDGVTFEMTFDYNDIAVKIMNAFSNGERIELVVLSTDSGIIALDDVYVASAAFAGGDSPEFRCAMQASAVRWV